MPYIDFTNGDSFDEMEELSKSLFGEAWDNKDNKEEEFYEDLLMEQREQM